VNNALCTSLKTHVRSIEETFLDSVTFFTLSIAIGIFVASQDKLTKYERTFLRHVCILALGPLYMVYSLILT
jgi:hypothetical protein